MEWFASICHTYIPEGGAFPSVMVTLFWVALLGGFLHCSFMCGPFVIAQTGSRLQNTPITQMTELTRLRGAAAVPYHLGRMFTYTLLGGLVALFSGFFNDSIFSITPYLLLLAGVLMVLSVVHPLALKLPFFGSDALSLLSAPVERIVHPLLQAPFGLKGFALGVILGFLPCSMLYAALAAAAATGNVWQGMASMAAFATGTVPSLLAVGLLGTLVLGQFRKKTRIVAKVGTALAGCWLCLIALNTIM